MLILTGKSKGKNGHVWDSLSIAETVSESVQMMLKSPNLGHCFHAFMHSFNKQLLSNDYMSGTF